MDYHLKYQPSTSIPFEDTLYLKTEQIYQSLIKKTLGYKDQSVERIGLDSITLGYVKTRFDNKDIFQDLAFLSIGRALAYRHGYPVEGVTDVINQLKDIAQKVHPWLTEEDMDGFDIDYPKVSIDSLIDNAAGFEGEVWEFLDYTFQNQDLRFGNTDEVDPVQLFYWIRDSGNKVYNWEIGGQQELKRTLLAQSSPARYLFEQVDSRLDRLVDDSDFRSCFYALEDDRIQ